MKRGHTHGRAAAALLDLQPERHNSTPPGSWLRDQYEAHRKTTVGDRTVTRCSMQQEALAPVDELLGRRTLDVMPAPPVSDYVPEMAAQLYGDDDGA